ncbi:MAG: hypothetical protein ACTSQK_02925 [Candidatus Heimdallarchaeota archaeon]
MGKFLVYEDEKLIGEAIPNKILYAGMAYTIDTIFGLEAWQSGVGGYDGSLPASGVWTPHRTVVIGTVADDNNRWMENNDWLDLGSGIKTGSIPIEGNSFAHVPALTDTYMSSAQSGNNVDYNVSTGLFFKLADRTIRTGRTVSIEATFNVTADPASTNAETILVGTEIRELGISLSIYPTGLIDPLSDRSHRPEALFCRAVRYSIEDGFLKDNPIKVGNNPVTVRYLFGEHT